MKKFIIIVLAVLLFVGILLPIKSSASEFEPYPETVGHWHMNDLQGIFDIYPNYPEVNYSFPFISMSMWMDGVTIDNATRMVYFHSRSGTSYPVYDDAYGWNIESARIVYISSPASMSIYNEFLKDFGTQISDTVPTCDGSCTLTDMDENEICDECGLAYSLRSTGYQYIHTVIIKTTTGHTMMDLMSNEPFTIRGFKYGATYRIETSHAVTVMKYERTTGDYELTYQGVSANPYPSRDNVNDIIISSTFNWYESIDSDEIFFPVPLWDQMEEIAQGEMTQAMPKVGQVVMTLVVCGVGLMASLALLVILARVFRRYRS